MSGLETRVARLKATGRRALAAPVVADRSPWDWYDESCACEPATRRLPRASARRIEPAPPAGDWRVWAYVAGRGAGKTRAGACWLQRRVEAGIMKLGCLIAPTAADIRDVMVEGPSGLINVAPHGAGRGSNRRNAAWNGPTAPRGLLERRGARARPRAEHRHPLG